MLNCYWLICKLFDKLPSQLKIPHLYISTLLVKLPFYHLSLRFHLQEIKRGQSEIVSGQPPEAGGQSKIKRGQSEIVSGQPPEAGGQSEIKRGQSEMVSGQSPKTEGQSEIKRGQSEMVSGQSPKTGGQSEIKRGQSEIISAQSLKKHLKMLLLQTKLSS